MSGPTSVVGTLVVSEILGTAAEEPWHERVHAADAAGTMDVVRISRTDAARRRMRLTSERGRDVALALARDASLCDGAVLAWTDALTLLARIDQGPRLRLVPGDAPSALRLGYFCGNLHWKADFRDGAIEIHMDGPEDALRARLADAAALASFSVQRLEAEE